ncbi:MAG: glycine zipper domain-containing protein [Candidatus Rokuibacteriota bacterium]
MTQVVKPRGAAVVALVGALLSGCATIPHGPSVMVLPGSTKSFEQFQTDDALCRRWASGQVGTTAKKASTQSTVGGGVIGAVVGAAAGAALGAAAGNPAVGAAAGAGVGLLGGTAIGASHADASDGSVQRRYDMSYTQCMYAKGNKVPVARGSRTQQQPAYTSPAPPPPPPPPVSAVPPTVPLPPPGPPPPPPPR